MRKMRFMLIAALLPLQGVAFAQSGGAVAQSYPISFYSLNPCNGEEVYFTGTAHTVTTPSANSNSNTQYHLTGTGNQGNQYVFNDNGHSTFSIDPDGTIRSSGSGTTRSITKGAAQNYLYSIKTTFTYNPNTGGAPSYTFETSTSCNGA